MFPCCLILSVVTPRNFAHLDNLVVSHSPYSIQDLDWPFAIGQVSAMVKLLHLQFLFWH
jgi:hypothetical protein